MAKAKGRQPGSGVKVRGFFRVQIVEQDGRIVGDSDWFPNQVTNLGKRDYLCTPLAGGTAKSISRMALGTGGVPAATDTSLAGELSHSTSGTRNRVAVQTSQVLSSQIEFYGTFASTNSSGFVTASTTINNIMVINDTTTGGTIFAGNTYPASVVNTNQDRTKLNKSSDVPLAA